MPFMPTHMWPCRKEGGGGGAAVPAAARRRGVWHFPAIGLFLFAPILFPALQAGEEVGLAEIREVLDRPVELVLKNGNRQTGTIEQWDGESLRLSVRIGGGSAEMRFPAEAIERIRFPGGEYLRTLGEWMRTPGREEDALDLFRAYYRQRGAYFDLLDTDELRVFVQYARFAIEQKKPLRAVAIIEVLRPHIQDEGLLERLDEEMLLAFFLGGMREQAESRAREWIRRAEPAGDSALGWRILAQLHFREERYEDAFWTALHPVAFANQLPMEHLNVCYAFAILAGEEIRLENEPTRLAREMRERGLAWPEDVGVLAGRAPDAFLAEPGPPPASASPADGAGELGPDEDGEEPLETPSPVDPVESLPTRINL